MTKKQTIEKPASRVISLAEHLNKALESTSAVIANYNKTIDMNKSTSKSKAQSAFSVPSERKLSKQQP